MKLDENYIFKLDNIKIKKIDDYYVLIFLDTHKYLVLTNSQYISFNMLLNKKTIVDTYNEQKVLNLQEYNNLLSDIFWANNGLYSKPFKLEDADNIEIKYDITYKCNTNCSHCFLPSFNSMKEIGISEWKKISDNIFSNINYKPYICISGGEPFLFPDMLRELIEYIYPKVSSIAILTNGFVISDWIDAKNYDMIDFFIKHIDAFQISLDGYDKETYENIRGKGNFRKLINTITYLDSIDKKMNLHATVSMENIDNIKNNFIDFVKKYNLYGKGKHHFSFSLVRSLGNGEKLNKEGKIINGVDFEKFLFYMQEKINKFYPKNLLNTDDLLSGTNCSVARQVCVAPNGLSYLCGISTSEPIADLINDDFKLVIKKYKEIREKMDQKNMLQCKGCELAGFCFGRCRIVNKMMTGSYNETICTENEKEEFYRSIIREKIVGVPY